MSRLTAVAAWLYLTALVAVVLAFRLIGERWWVVLACLYLPRVGFAAPLFVLGPALWWFRRRRLLLTQLAAALIVLFPLMGLELPKLREASAGPRTLRLASYNVWYGYGGVEALGRQVDDLRADVVVLQATSNRTDEFFQRHLAGWNLHVGSGFMAASRLPIREVYVAEPGPDGAPKPAHVRYTVEAPFGLLDVYSIHPWSPRRGLDKIRGAGFRFTLLRGNVAAEAAAERLASNAAARQQQLEAVLADVTASRHPFVIAGDTNVPGGSWLYQRTLARFRDAFDEAGSGFGYTFPTHPFSWMRIDRILLGPGLRCARIETGGRGGSDHRPIVAEIGPVP
jgi:endonuclease/exonuclease/phosphatase (EEP) superfamily protein YafD